jgi:putative protease
VVLRLEQPLRRGDGIVFDRGDPQHQEQGGQVYDVLDASGSSLDSGAEGA